MTQVDKMRTIIANTPGAIGTAVFEQAGVKRSSLAGRSGSTLRIRSAGNDLWRVRG